MIASRIRPLVALAAAAWFALPALAAEPHPHRREPHAVAARLGGAGHAGQGRDGDRQGHRQRQGRCPGAADQAPLRGQPGHPGKGPRRGREAHQQRQGRRPGGRPPELGLPGGDRGRAPPARCPTSTPTAGPTTSASAAIRKSSTPRRTTRSSRRRWPRRWRRMGVKRVVAFAENTDYGIGQAKLTGELLKQNGAADRIQVRDARPHQQGLHGGRAAAARQPARRHRPLDAAAGRLPGDEPGLRAGRGAEREDAPLRRRAASPTTRTSGRT